MQNPLPGTKILCFLIISFSCAAFLLGQAAQTVPPASEAATDLNLPDPLKARDGTLVTTAEMWRTKRRPEVLDLFRTHVYGRAPLGRPEHLKFEIVEKTSGAMEGKATRKRVKISFTGPGGEGAINLTLFIPNSPKPSPCFVLICNRTPGDIDPTRNTKSDFWPAEEIAARGGVGRGRGVGGRFAGEGLFAGEQLVQDHAA